MNKDSQKSPAGNYKNSGVSKAEAEKIAAQVPKLLMSAQQAAQSIITGEHPLKTSGQGHEFWQYRRYESHDSPREIDWRQSAKSDRIFVREKEKHSSQSFAIWVDRTPGMSWSGERSQISKERASQIMALALSIVVIHNGEMVRLYREGSSKVQNLKALEDFAFELLSHSSDLQEASFDHFEDLLPVYFPTRTIPVLFSDFLLPPKALERFVSQMASKHPYGILVRVIDPYEIELPLKGRVRFSGVSSAGKGKEEFLIENVDSVRKGYTERFNNHRALLFDLAEKSGWSLYEIKTNEAFALLLQKIWYHLATNTSPGTEQ